MDGRRQQKPMWKQNPEMHSDGKNGMTVRERAEGRAEDGEGEVSLSSLS